MEGINDKNPATGDIKAKKRYWKFIVSFLAVLIGIFILYVIGFWAVRYYKDLENQRNFEKALQATKQAEEEDYNRAMADTYGGKTPQETLKLYIAAVEKGDYELASKYFIGDYQEKELKSLQNSSRKNIDNILELLRQALNSSGSYSWDKKGYAIRKSLLVDFKIYPNGIWKIIEI